MRLIYTVFVLFSCLCCDEFVDAQTSVKSELPATLLKPYGRAFIDKQENLELISSAVHFGFSFTGKQCTIYASVNDANAHNYLQYELDGVYQKKIKVIGDESQPITITATTDGLHSIWMYKVTREATTGPIIIQKITGNDLKVLTPSTEPLIEFIGNSITCGAASDTAEVPCGQGEYHDHHNAYYAYGPRVARALHVKL